ncbi:MAG: hypothetical protein WA703_05635, partial [Pseudolabrys sp.]
MSVNTRYDSALADSRSLLDELISPVATATAKHRLRIIDRITDLFAAGSRSYSHEQVARGDGTLVFTDIGSLNRVGGGSKQIRSYRKVPKT